MVFISEGIDYWIFILASLITIISCIGYIVFKTGKLIKIFISDIHNSPKQFVELSSQYDSMHREVQKLKERIYRIDGQVDAYCKMLFSSVP